MPKVTVVVPTYNEAGNVQPLIRRILAACPWDDLSICIADDNSPDGTADLADAIGDPRVYAMRRTTDRGYGKAVNAGIAYGLDRGSDFVVTMDADFSHQPEVIPAMIDEAEREPRADLIIGSRYAAGGADVKDWPLARLILSRCASFYVQTLVGVRVNDTTSGFRCWRASFLRKLPLSRIQASGYAYIYETLFYTAQHRGRVREARNVYVGRVAGESKMTLGIVIEGLKVPLMLRVKHLLGRNQ